MKTICFLFPLCFFGLNAESSETFEYTGDNPLVNKGLKLSLDLVDLQGDLQAELTVGNGVIEEHLPCDLLGSFRKPQDKNEKGYNRAYCHQSSKNQENWEQVKVVIDQKWERLESGKVEGGFVAHFGYASDTDATGIDNSNLKKLLDILFKTIPEGKSIDSEILSLKAKDRDWTKIQSNPFALLRHVETGLRGAITDDKGNFTGPLLYSGEVERPVRVWGFSYFIDLEQLTASLEAEWGASSEAADIHEKLGLAKEGSLSGLASTKVLAQRVSKILKDSLD